MPNDLNQLKQDIKKLESYRVITSDELKSFLADVANILNQWKSATITVNKETKDTLNLIVKQVNEEHDRILQDVEKTSQMSKSDVTEAISSALKDCKKMCDEIMAMEFKDGLDGLDGLDGNDGVDGKDGSPDTPEQIKDKLESLKGDSRIDKSAIKGLEKVVSSADLDRAISILDQRSQYLINKTVKHDSTLSGEGTDASPLSVVSGPGVGVNVEEPTGTVDGSNTTFTVTNTPKMAFFDGVAKFETLNYTYSAPTITITDGAPPVLSIRTLY